MAHGGMYRNFTFYFLRGGIAGSLAGFQGFRLWNYAARKQYMLKKRGFSGLSMTGDSDISDFIC
jgi:hypothetical protein